MNTSTDDQPITLWVIEDNDTYRDTIVALVDSTEGMHCTHACQSCEKALKALEDDFAPEIILMDIGLPGMSGIEGLARIKAISPSTGLIMLTVFDDEKQIFDAICSGASGYLLKSAQPHEIIGAVQSGHQTRVALPDQLREDLLQSGVIVRPCKEDHCLRVG